LFVGHLVDCKLVIGMDSSGPDRHSRQKDGQEQVFWQDPPEAEGCGSAAATHY
jgi:hypothetical protein